MKLSAIRNPKITIAFDDADGEGIVFFGNYFRLAHRALEAWLPLNGITWKEWFAHPEYGVPLRHVEADYLKPLRPGDECEAVIQVVELKDSSVVFAYEFRDLTGQVHARLKTVHVFMGRADWAKRAIPEDLKLRLARLRET